MKSKLQRAIVMLGIVNWHTAALAADQPSQIDLLDNVCISGRLDRTLTGKSVAMYIKNFKLEPLDVPMDALRLSLPEAVEAWGMRSENVLFIVSYSEKPFESGILRSCNIMAEGNTLDILKSAIESRYRSRLVIDQPQGQWQLAVYEMQLGGFPSASLMTIQAPNPDVTSNGKDYTFISLSDRPSIE